MNEKPKETRARVYLRRAVLAALDAAIVAFSFYFALLLRADGAVEAAWWPHNLAILYHNLPWIVAVYVASFLLGGLYSVLWKYAGERDLLRLAVIVAVPTGIVYVVNRRCIHGVLFNSANCMAAVLILLLVGGLAYLLGGERSGAKARALLPLGFGLLFLGMGMMEQALLPLSERADFRALFMRCDSLPTGILAGALVTALIQSSSASVGMLQALASTGMVPFSTAVPIIMGQNIGTCVTVLLASVGSGLNARRAAMVHFYFNLFGTIAFCALIYGAKATVGIPFWGEAVTRSGISLFHTLFNVVNTLWMMPLLDRLLRLVERTVGGRRAAGLAGSRTA